MTRTECEGCGAPLDLSKHECEYCRRDITPVAEAHGGAWGAERYSLGYCDPRQAYNQYNQQCNTSPGQRQSPHNETAYTNAASQLQAGPGFYETCFGNVINGWWR